MESFETEQMIQYAFYINIVITTGGDAANLLI